MPNQPRPLPIPDPTYETVNGDHETAQAEVVTEPKPLPNNYEEGNAQDYELWQNKEEQGE